jgi:hypothetical protein
MRKTCRPAVWIVIAFLLAPSPAVIAADELIEKAGVGVGLTAGNVLFIPVKAVSLTIGALSGALSYVVTGGDTEVSRQVWRDTTQGPYVITREIARTAIGDRPEKDFATE